MNSQPGSEFSWVEVVEVEGAALVFFYMVSQGWKKCPGFPTEICGTDQVFYSVFQVSSDEKNNNKSPEVTEFQSSPYPIFQQRVLVKTRTGPNWSDHHGNRQPSILGLIGSISLGLKTFIFRSFGWP